MGNIHDQLSHFATVFLTLFTLTSITNTFIASANLHH